MALAAYTPACSKNTPGNDSILRLSTVANITSVTVTSGEITAITMATTSTYFFKYTVEIDSFVATQEGSGKNGNMAYNKIWEFRLKPLGTALNTARNNLVDESACGLVGVRKDNNGTYWLEGYNSTDLFNRPLTVIQDNDTSGAAPTDENAGTATIQLNNMSGQLALPFASGSVTTILASIDAP